MKRWLLPIWLIHTSAVNAGEEMTVNISANVIGSSCYIAGGTALNVNLESTPLGGLEKFSKGILVKSPTYVVECDGVEAGPILTVGEPEYGQTISHIHSDGLVLKNASGVGMASGVGIFSWLYFKGERGDERVRMLRNNTARLKLTAAGTGAGFESQFHFTAMLQRTSRSGGDPETLSAGLVQVSVPLTLSYQ